MEVAAEAVAVSAEAAAVTAEALSTIASETGAAPEDSADSVGRSNHGRARGRRRRRRRGDRGADGRGRDEGRGGRRAFDFRHARPRDEETRRQGLSLSPATPRARGRRVGIDSRRAFR